MEKTREQYIEEAYEIMQDVEEVADLLEDRDEAEKAYCNGKSALAFNIINQLYVYLNDEHKAELASYLAKDAHEAMIEKACKAFCEARCSLQYDMCQQGGWKKDCLAYFNFERQMKGE